MLLVIAITLLITSLIDVWIGIKLELHNKIKDTLWIFSTSTIVVFILNSIIEDER